MSKRILCIGAHPDDCEGSVGGTALLWRQRGDEVRFVSVTDGSRGHFDPQYLADPQMLVERRMAEARQATEPYGIGFECLGICDGEVYVTQAATEDMVRLIRAAQPDLIVLNRPNDYHRDHRYAAQIVLDSIYMLTVPFLCPDVPALTAMPIVAYFEDRFTEGGAFRADIVIAIDEVVERKRKMMLAHHSQYMEWLPYNASGWNVLPTDMEASVREGVLRSSRACAEKYRDRLQDGCEFAEAFQISEYGGGLDAHPNAFPVYGDED